MSLIGGSLKLNLQTRIFPPGCSKISRHGILSEFSVTLFFIDIFNYNFTNTRKTLDEKLKNRFISVSFPEIEDLKMFNELKADMETKCIDEIWKTIKVFYENPGDHFAVKYLKKMIVKLIHSVGKVEGFCLHCSDLNVK
jgi:hypothetical protein